MFAEKQSLFKRIMKALGISVAVIAVAAVIYFALKLYNAYLNRPADVVEEPEVFRADITLETGITYYSAVTESKAVFCSNESITFLDFAGKKSESVQTTVSNPLISTAGEYTLVSDKGSRSAYLYKGSRLYSEIETGGSIISAAVSQSGHLVFVISGELHKNSVVVLQSDGTEIFKWNSGGLSVLAADISKDGKEICVSALNTDDGVLKSHIIMFNTGKDKPFTNDVYEGLVFASVVYESNYIYVVGDAVTYIYNSYGKLTGTIDYSDRTLLTYACDKNNLVLAFSNLSHIKGGCLVESYDTAGNMQGRFELMNEMRFMDVKGGGIALSSGSSITVLDLKCRERKNILLSQDIRDFMFLGDSSKGMGISGSGVNIIRIK